MTPDTPPAFDLRPVRWGLLLALLTILFGFGFGAAFGGFEDQLKANLKARAAAAPQDLYPGGDAQKKEVLDKAWSYYKRAHLHAGAIGCVALACSLLLAALRRPSCCIKGATAAAMGIGGLGYALFWLIAGTIAPTRGGTDAAKASLEWLAVPTSGLLLLGLLTVLLLTARDFCTCRRSACSTPNPP